MIQKNYRKKIITENSQVISKIKTYNINLTF